MEIKRIPLSKVNEIIEIQVLESDYQPQVNKKINETASVATFKGFRKGHVPKSVVEKQYGKAIKIEELNKVAANSLEKFLVSEKINLLGNPLPIVKEQLDLNAQDYTFQYEIGIAPEFNIVIENAKNIVKYNVIAEEKLINDQVIRIQKQYGKAISQETITSECDIYGIFLNHNAGINTNTSINITMFKDKNVGEQFIGKKPGDTITVHTKGLFEDDRKLIDILKVSHELVDTIDVEVQFTIERITLTEPAELTKELFDKLFGEGNVASLNDLKLKIKQDAETQFAQQADQKFLDDVTDTLISNTPFELPENFLQRWLQTVGEKQLTAQEATQEYQRSERGLRYQLIESKILSENNINLSFDELKEFTSQNIRIQMAQFGQMNPTQEDVDGIVARVLQNQDEVKRITQQLISQKTLELFKNKVPATIKEVTYDQFVAEMYGE